MCLAKLSLLLAAACGGQGATQGSTSPAPDAHPLSALAAERVIVLPTYALSVSSDVAAAWRVDRPRELLRALDADIAAALDDRGLRRGWVLPADLQASYTRNPTYATDPYALAEAPLRSRAFVAGSRLGEPLASQLRTMIALHENARLVLAPVELRVERVAADSATGRPVLRVVLLDPRFAEARWVGEVRGDAANGLSPEVTTLLAKRLANLITAP
jgi:hypothetical protein